MSISRYEAAHATEGVAGVLLEVIDAALTHAAAQHSAVCNRSLYDFAAQIKYAIQATETLVNSEKNAN